MGVWKYILEIWDANKFWKEMGVQKFSPFFEKSPDHLPSVKNLKLVKITFFHIEEISNHEFNTTSFWITSWYRMNVAMMSTKLVAT